MKKYSKISIIFLLSFFTLLICSPMVLSTTIGDTTFPAKVDKMYVWNFTYPSVVRGYKYGFRTDSITQGVYLTHESLIVMATILGYTPGLGWMDLENSSVYLATNETEDFLRFNIDTFYYPFVIPTPINLSIVADAVALALFRYDYIIDGNTILFNDTYPSYEFTFNSKGFLTTAIEKVESELSFKLVLAGGDGGIPFGIYFLIPTVSSIAVIIIFVKKRQLTMK
jgi:hypothetical protein